MCHHIEGVGGQPTLRSAGAKISQPGQNQLARSEAASGHHTESGVVGALGVVRAARPAAGLGHGVALVLPAVERASTQRGPGVMAPGSTSTARADSPPAPRLGWSGPYLFRSGAGQRPYFVYTPTGYRPGTRVPLVVMLHGCSQTPRGIAVATGWNDLAEEHNLIVVYPGQTLAVSPDAITRPNGQAPEQPSPGPATEMSGDALDACW